MVSNLVVSTTCIFHALFCALLHIFPLFCRLAIALFCAHLRSLALIKKHCSKFQKLGTKGPQSLSEFQGILGATLGLGGHHSLFSVHVLFPQVFLAFIYGLFSATRTPNSQSRSYVHSSLSIRGEWSTNHSNHIHIFTPITRIVATKLLELHQQPKSCPKNYSRSNSCVTPGIGMPVEVCQGRKKYKPPLWKPSFFSFSGSEALPTVVVYTLFSPV